jgi:hypothetical protein
MVGELARARWWAGCPLSAVTLAHCQAVPTPKPGASLEPGRHYSPPVSRAHTDRRLRSAEHGLTVWVDLKHGKELHRVTAFNSTVSVVEPATSWFDPQVIFMYLIVITALLGAGYFAFTTYFAPPQKSRKGPRKHA